MTTSPSSPAAPAALAGGAGPAPVWRVRGRDVVLDRPFVLGVVNVTPDSFSDGGRYDGLDQARAHADRVVAEGARVVDVGGESTRPASYGEAAPVSPAEELRRVLPVIEAIRRETSAPLSIDTRNVPSSVARATTR